MRLTVLPRELAEGEVSRVPSPEAQLTSLSRAPLSLLLFLIVSSERSVWSECCRELRERHPNVLELILDIRGLAAENLLGLAVPHSEPLGELVGVRTSLAFETAAAITFAALDNSATSSAPSTAPWYSSISPRTSLTVAFVPAVLSGKPFFFRCMCFFRSRFTDGNAK